MKLRISEVRRLICESHDIRALARLAYIDIVNEEPESAALRILQDALREDGREGEAEQLEDAEERPHCLRSLLKLPHARPDPTEFERNVARIMTPEEVRTLARRMSLDPELVEWIHDQFLLASDHRNHYFSDTYEEGGVGVGSRGRMALGQSWQDQYYELAMRMGFSEDDPSLSGGNPDVDRVWNAFFEE